MSHKMSNSSGIHPVRDMVLMLPEEEVKSKEGMIVIPENVKSRESAAQIFGKIVALGEGAFKYEEKQYGVFPPLEVGARAMFAKYSGIVCKGKDGVNYRLVRDDDILALVDKEVKKEIES